jgi:Protein of unknown function (DUF3040)/MMPL family
MDRAGHGLAIALIVVAAGIASLAAARLEALRAFGPGLALAVLIAMVVAVTLTTALIAIFGSLLFRPGPADDAGAGFARDSPTARRWGRRRRNSPHKAVETPIPGQMVHGGGRSRHGRLAMGLARNERRALAGIERSLRGSDPRLATRLATFTSLTAGNGIPRWESLSPWWLRLRRLPLLMAGTAATALFVAALVLGQVRHSSGAQRTVCVAAGRLSICRPTAAPSHHPVWQAGPARAASRARR